jgi:hypothetical protein
VLKTAGPYLHFVLLTGCFQAVLNTFAKSDFDYYWFQTGTPTFLVKMLKDADFDLRDFFEGITLNSRSITDYRVGSSDPVSERLLYHQEL